MNNGKVAGEIIDRLCACVFVRVGSVSKLHGTNMFGLLAPPPAAVFKSRLKTFFSSRLSLLSLLTNTLPGPSASEVTTLWRYTNLLIIIIIIIIYLSRATA